MNSLAFKHLPLAILVVNASFLTGGQKIWGEEKPSSFLLPTRLCFGLHHRQ